MKYADVIIDNNSVHTDELYTYAVPDDIEPGTKVFVTFGRGNRPKDAYVIDIKDTPKEGFKIKEIEGSDDRIVLTREMIETSLFIKRRTLCKTIDALKLFLPAGSALKSGKSRTAPYEGDPGEAQIIEDLTSEQKAAIDAIEPHIRNAEYGLYLLHGVTGSGKTEVYMRLIDETIKSGRSAIMLVPEISLTKQIIQRFLGRFGAENIAVLHSKLSPGDRYDEWQRIRRGEVKIAIGARSAIFAPFENIGCIIMDEEHETSYKSDMNPKYDAIEVAIKRAKSHGAVVIAGSATPSVATYRRAADGIYEKLELTKRYNEVKLPHVDVVDMRDEMLQGNKTIFSDRLKSEMDMALESGKQVILFLNRRGYSPFISCRECGYVMKCEDCGISMVYHKHENAAVCHYCGKKIPVPAVCPECGSRYIRQFGTGTEKLEEEVQALYPDRKVDRLDLDTTKRKGSIEKILERFRKGKTDILIGTQLVAKGLDFDNVGLVGIISADITLNIPDFRSAEKTFQLITQAAGRAGRGDEQGRVVIQTYTPDHYAIQCAKNHDYKAFFEIEDSVREALSYPPYTDMMQIVVTADEEKDAESGAQHAEDRIRIMLGPESSNLLGAKPAPMAKLSGRYRYHMVLKCPRGKRSAYSKIIDTIKTENLADKNCRYNISVDINPYSFM